MVAVSVWNWILGAGLIRDTLTLHGYVFSKPCCSRMAPVNKVTNSVVKLNGPSAPSIVISITFSSKT